jgi:hypothetical protein
VSDVLMRVVVQTAAFFELCDEDVLDLQIAVKQLEWISWELRRLDSQERDALIAFVDAEAQATGDPRYRRFLLEFPVAFGLREEA